MYVSVFINRFTGEVFTKATGAEEIYKIAQRENLPVKIAKRVFYKTTQNFFFDQKEIPAATWKLIVKRAEDKPP